MNDAQPIRDTRRDTHVRQRPQKSASVRVSTNARVHSGFTGSSGRWQPLANAVVKPAKLLCVGSIPTPASNSARVTGNSCAGFRFGGMSNGKRRDTESDTTSPQLHKAGHTPSQLRCGFWRGMLDSRPGGGWQSPPASRRPDSPRRRRPPSPGHGARHGFARYRPRWPPCRPRGAPAARNRRAQRDKLC